MFCACSSKNKDIVPDKKPEEKLAEKKAAEPPKPEAPKAAPAPEVKPVEKKADAPADKKPEEKHAEKKASEPPKPEAPKAAPAPPAKPEEKKADAPADKKPEEKKAAPAPAKAPAKKTEKTEKPVGTAAVGPTGTLITKLLGEKLAPPTLKDKKALPIPGEGEAFAVTLHPRTRMRSGMLVATGCFPPVSREVMPRSTISCPAA